MNRPQQAVIGTMAALVLFGAGTAVGNITADDPIDVQVQSTCAAIKPADHWQILHEGLRAINKDGAVVTPATDGAVLWACLP